MKKNLKSCVEHPIEGDVRCLLDMNHYQRYEKSGLVPDLRHNRSSHMTAAWRFDDLFSVCIPMGGVDLSAYRYLTFSVFSVGGAGSSFSLRFDSDEKGSGKGGYEEILEIRRNGWNDYRVELPTMRAVGNPLGWNRIGSLCFDRTFGGKGDSRETVLYIDNLFVWEGIAPPLYEKMPELKGAAVFAKSGKYALVNRLRVRTSFDGADARPFEEKGVLWLPMAPVAAGIAHSAVADNLANTLSFTYRRKKYLFEAKKKFLLVNGEKQPLPFAPVAKEGVLFFPADYVRDFFRWRQIFTDPMGLVILSNRREIFDSTRDASVIRTLISDLTFVRPTAETVVADLRRRFPNPLRGRLFASFDDLMRLRKEAKTEPSLKEMTEMLKVAYGKKSRAFMDAPLTHGLARECELLWNFSLLYRLTGEKLYCERALAEALAITENEEWRSEGFAVFGDLLIAMAVSYDWCHHVWTEGQKARIERALLRNGMRVGLDFYDGKNQIWRRGGAAAAKVGAGMLALSLTLADIYPETALRLIECAMRSLEDCFTAFSPDGGCAESALAWEKQAKALALTVAMLQRACGTDYGFSSFPGFSSTAYFPIYTETQNGAWNYHDCENRALDTSVLSFFAKRNEDAALAWLRRAQLGDGGKRLDPLDFLFYTPVKKGENPHLALDAVYRKAGLAVMRSDWGREANVLGLHGGSNAVVGGDSDAGGVLLEMGGVRFFCETGGEENLPILLRRSTEGQNTLAIAPSESNTPSQNPEAVAALLEMRSDTDRAYAVVDMSATSDLLCRAKRGVLLTDRRSVAVIQDELTVAEPTEAVWYAWTKADVTLSKSRRCAYLVQNGKTLLCRLGGVGFSARFEAEIFETSGMTRLSVRIAVKERLRLAVSCKLIEEGESRSQKPYDIIPISRWGV